MTGAAQKIQPIVEKNVFLMLQECHMDMVHLQPILESQRYVAQDKNVVMLERLILLTSLLILHSVVLSMRSLICKNMLNKVSLLYVVVKMLMIYAVHTTKQNTVNHTLTTSVVKMVKKNAMVPVKIAISLVVTPA